MAALPSAAQVAVIGAGVMGTSAAYHLAVKGVDVVLLERDTVAAGSTSKAAGGFRAQFSDELNVRMAVENVRRLVRFEEEFGVDIDLKQWGYLFLLRESELEQFEKALAIQHRHGVPSEMIGPDEVAALVPGIAVDDIAGATFCPTDGYCTPEAVAQGYAQAASQAGATIVQDCTVHQVSTDGSKATGLRTSQGDVAVDQVVVAAGVWSADLVAPLGLELPIQAEKRHVWLTSGADGFPAQLPLVIDFATGFYFHREGDGLLFGGREPTLEALAPAVLARAPTMLDLEIRPGWWGYYEISPDHNALVGTAPTVEGLHYATGFSGHGFQQGPVVGEHLAELAVGDPPTFDLSAFDAARFEQGHQAPEGLFV